MIFQIWSRHINRKLRFVQVTNTTEEVDVEITFVTGNHGDGEPFDGKGGDLAHAFFLDSDYPGTQHYDSEESWTHRSSAG